MDDEEFYWDDDTGLYDSKTHLANHETPPPAGKRSRDQQWKKIREWSGGRRGVHNIWALCYGHEEPKGIMEEKGMDFTSIIQILLIKSKSDKLWVLNPWPFDYEKNVPCSRGVLPYHWVIRNL